MTNIRNKSHPKGFTILDNRGLNCPNISFRATGLWAYVKGKPDSWEISVNHLAQQKSEGRDAIYKALEELVKAGLVKRERVRVGGKFKEYRYDFYDSPQPLPENPPLPEKPDTEKPDTEKPDTENPTQVNTDPLKTDLLKTDLINQESRDFEEWLDKRFRGDPNVRNPTALITYIINKGTHSPEYREWQAQAEQTDTQIDESLYAHLWS